MVPENVHAAQKKIFWTKQWIDPVQNGSLHDLYVPKNGKVREILYLDKKTWLEWGLERNSSSMEWTGQRFCCKYPRQYMVLHHMQKLLEFGKACCHFACASVSSTFAVLASFRCSACGPSTTYVGIKASSVLQIHEYWVLERSCFGWNGVELTFKFVCRFLPHVNSSCVHILAFGACALKRARHWRAGLAWPDLTWPGQAQIHVVQDGGHHIFHSQTCLCWKDAICSSALKTVECQTFPFCTGNMRQSYNKNPSCGSQHPTICREWTTVGLKW